MPYSPMSGMECQALSLPDVNGGVSRAFQ
jgi:hypothetical protein